LSKNITLAGIHRTEKTLVYREALKLEEQAEKEFHTGKFQLYGRSK